MSESIKTTGQLRALLIGTIEGVCSGRIELQKASAIAKLAGQVSASMTAEAQMALVAHKLGVVPGTLQIASEPQPKTAPALPELTLADKSKAWCAQCEMRVASAEAATCKSPFCSLKKAA